MSAENNMHASARAGWVLYDGECAICIRLARRFGPVLKRHRFNLAPLQTPWVRERLELAEDAPLDEMHVLSRSGTLMGGPEAVAFLAGQVWWAWPLCVLAKVPAGMWLLRRVYRWVAAHRYCAGQCDPARRGGRS